MSSRACFVLVKQCVETRRSGLVEYSFAMVKLHSVYVVLVKQCMEMRGAGLVTFCLAKNCFGKAIYGIVLVLYCVEEYCSGKALFGV